MLKLIYRKTLLLALLTVLPFATTQLAKAQYDINILVLGSSRSFSSDHYSSVPRNQNAFNPQLVVNQLQSILDGDPAFTSANVVFEDIYESDSTVLGGTTVQAKNYSLLGYYSQPDDSDTPLVDERDARWSKLKGQAGTAWDYVVIMDDPSIIANVPGVHARGVKYIVDLVRQGTAEPILMMQWPHAGSSVPTEDFGEVSYRVGDTGGIPVSPAGYAWNSYTSKDAGTHPTPDGSYLAAASLYSTILDRNATTSSYTYNDTLANLAHTTVQARANQAPYPGHYSKATPHQILWKKDRAIDGHRTGSSSEAGFMDANNYSGGRNYNNLVQSELFIKHDSGPRFHFGRGPNSGGGMYVENPASGGYFASIGFSFQILNTGPNTMSATGTGHIDMLDGMDYVSYWPYGDQRLAFYMLQNDQISKNVRTLPIFSLWAAANTELGLADPYYDGRHYAADVNEIGVSYFMTLVTGRCPIGKNGTERERERQRIGYEAAWTMGTLSLRPPGFSTFPSSVGPKTLAVGEEELMEVYFVNPPQSAVTVSATPSAGTAALVNPKVLSFDSSNHDTIQNVRVIGLPGAAASQAFDVNFMTSSTDICFNTLDDTWAYTIQRSETQALSLVEQSDRQETTSKNVNKTIDLQVVGSAESNTILAQPFHGTLSWSGTDLIYTPDADFIGNDTFAFAVNIGGTLTKGYIQMTVEDLPSVVIVESGGSTDVIEGGATDTYTLQLSEAPASNVVVTITPDAEVTVSPTTVTFTTGNWNIPQTVTVTAVNDSDHEGIIHTGTISHSTSSSDPDWNAIAVNNVTASITDNDNTPPSVDAGLNQTVSLSGAVPWTPEGISTVAWFDANDVSTITKDGSNKVSQWNDKSVINGTPNNRHATQATSTRQPSYLVEDAMVGGRPSIGNISASGQIGLVTPSMTARNVYVVTYYKDGLDASFDGYSTLFSGPGTNGQYRVMANQLTPDFIGTSYFNDAGTFKNGSTTNAITGVLPMPTSLFKFKSSAARTQPYSLGFNPTNNSRDWQGSYCEWIFTDGMEDPATEQQIEGYLAHKWGIAASLPGDHPYRNSPPGGSGVVVNLDGTVSDTEGDPLTTTWTLVSGNASAVSIEDPNAVDTTTTITEAGTYVFRLTVNDGYGEIVDTVTITVAPTNIFSSWIAGYDVGVLTLVSDDPDGDGIANSLENYFGTDPSAASQGIVAVAADTEANTFTFSHPINETPATDLTATYRWSKDLISHHNDGVSDGTTTVTFVQSAPSNGRVTVTATMTGTIPDRLFVSIQVTQN